MKKNKNKKYLTLALKIDDYVTLQNLADSHNIPISRFAAETIINFLKSAKIKPKRKLLEPIAKLIFEKDLPQHEQINFLYRKQCEIIKILEER